VQHCQVGPDAHASKLSRRFRTEFAKILSLSLPYVLIFRKEDPLFLLFLCLQGKEVAGRF
jgi:hypothetical protein